MARHHIVQDKYLEQWHIEGTKNHLNVFIIPEGKCNISNTKSPLFWRKDFNIFDINDEKKYLPEKITAFIDSKGIEAIRKIDYLKQEQLSSMDRSSIAFYVALQYIRTPKRREETDKFIGSIIKYYMRKDISSLDKVMLSKNNLLEDKSNSKMDTEVLEKIKKMSQEEINQEIFRSIHEDDIKIILTKTGHSKNILKVSRYAEKIFKMHWSFLVAPKSTYFATSDNPCFVISDSKIMNGLLSPNSSILFPLRPDICICIEPGKKNQMEYYVKLDKKKVRNINSLILKNSYDCFVTKDIAQLNNIIKGFDYKNHKKSKDTVIRESENFILFNTE